MLSVIISNYWQEKKFEDFSSMNLSENFVSDFQYYFSGNTDFGILNFQEQCCKKVCERISVSECRNWEIFNHDFRRRVCEWFSAIFFWEPNLGFFQASIWKKICEIRTLSNVWKKIKVIWCELHVWNLLT